MRLGAALWVVALLVSGLVARSAQATPPPCCSSDGQMSATSCGANNEDDNDDTAALNLALSCPSPQGTPFVRFPAGHYVIAGAVTSALDGQSLVFADGSLVDIRGGTLTVSGARSRVSGLVARLTMATTATFAAVRLSGEGVVAEGLRVEVTADVPNASLVRLSGDRVRVRDLKIVGDARAFLYGLHVQAESGGEARYVTVDGMEATLDPNDAHRTVTYGALVYLRGRDSKLVDLYVKETGRMLFPSGVVVVDGHVDVLDNPRITATGAQYAIYRKYGAEFFEVDGGLLDGNEGSGVFRTGSEGIYSSQFAGHLKVFATAIIGWDYGVGFHGSHDTPNLYGAVIANNGTAGILVDAYYDDSFYGAGDWPVSGLTVSGAYYEEKAHPQQAFILLRSGAVFGMTVTGCYVGYVSRMLKVEPAMGGNGGIFIAGNRFASAPGGATVEPNVNSGIVIGINALSGSNVQSVGSYASKAVVQDDPVLGGLTLGAAGARLSGHYTTVATANFGNALTAGACLELAYTVAGVLSGDSVNVSLSSGLAGKAGLLFFPYVSAPNEVTLRACNYGGVNATSASGSARFDVWKH